MFPCIGCLCHIYASHGGGSSINEPKMHRREWQGLYYTDELVHMCTDICCDALSICHHHTEKLRLSSETSLPQYYNASCWFGTVC